MPGRASRTDATTEETIGRKGSNAVDNPPEMPNPKRRSIKMEWKGRSRMETVGKCLQRRLQERPVDRLGCASSRIPGEEIPSEMLADVDPEVSHSKR